MSQCFVSDVDEYWFKVLQKHLETSNDLHLLQDIPMIPNLFWECPLFFSKDDACFIMFSWCFISITYVNLFDLLIEQQFSHFRCIPIKPSAQTIFSHQIIYIYMFYLYEKRSTNNNMIPASNQKSTGSNTASAAPEDASRSTSWE